MNNWWYSGSNNEWMNSENKVNANIWYNEHFNTVVSFNYLKLG